MVLVWSLALVASPVQAADCDPAALKAAVEEATPLHLGARYAKWAACDPEGAAPAAKEVVPRFLASERTNPGVLAALRAGAVEPVIAWMAKLQPNELGPTIDWLGHQCDQAPQVGEFFVQAQATETERFWSERWYRGLADCSTAEVQELLTTALENRRDDRDRTRFFALVGLYARNLGAEALPTLEALLAEEPENQRRLVIEAWADVADVGNEDGMDPDAAKAAVASLHSVLGEVPPTAADIVRNTLASLGDDVGAEASVALRWPERATGERYRYAVCAVEQGTCKNGKAFATLHLGWLHEPRERWPDTLEEGLEGHLSGPWKLGRTASKCKGEGTITVAMTAEPVETGGDARDWFDAQREAFAPLAEAAKARTLDHDPVDM